MATIDTDYLVIGAGASALAFVDTLLTETDAHITIVDKRDKPGGHWNDAYPFVRLHQPSSFYGVPSTPLGAERIDETGTNKGFYELATGVEIAAYFDDVMRARFKPSGRVVFLPMTEHVGGDTVRGVLSGETTRINVRRRLVDARLSENTIPLTHARQFRVADGVACAPPNDLPRLAGRFERFTVLGAGKTAIDSLVWLLENGAPPDAVLWAPPRDPWLINRAHVQPTGPFFHATIGGAVRQFEAMSETTSAEDFADRMEAADLWLRPDPDVRPAMIHGATVSPAEIDLVRRVRNVVRRGRVREIEPDRLVFDDGAQPVAPGALHIDCTASALTFHEPVPVFQEDRISIQMIRLFQPTFSAALTARIEAEDLSDDAKNALAKPTPMTDTVDSWLRSQVISMMNQYAWSQNKPLRRWIGDCRLDGFARPIREVNLEDPDYAAVVDRLRALAQPAVANAMKLSA
ncbi:MAG: NAD(P)-binding protein [Pseudomonadota bacterium]